MEGQRRDEAERWSRARDGDGEAFGALFGDHRERVYRHARRLVESTADAEDVTAAAFLELWRRRRAVRLVDGSVLPWLITTTTNVARNKRRSTFRYRRFLASLPRQERVLDGADVALDQRLDLDPAMRTALRSLEPKDLSLLALVGLEDYTLADAATATGITTAAAKTRLHRARRRLRQQLRKNSPNDDEIPEVS